MNIELFYLINHLPHTFLLDSFFLFIHLITDSGIIFLLIILFNLRDKDKNRKKYAILSFVALVITNITVELGLKNIFHEIRPSEVLSNVYVLGLVPSSYSFPSGQTASAFVFAALSFLMLKNYKESYLIYALALLTAFDRIYIGHHYPLDVIGGIFVGSFISVIVWRISLQPSYQKFFKKFSLKKIS